MVRPSSVAWYQRDSGVWLIAGAIGAGLLGLVGYLALHGPTPRWTTTPIAVAALTDGTALVVERRDRTEPDGDGGGVVSTRYHLRRFQPSTGAALAQRALAGPVRCAAAIDAWAWCTSGDGTFELVDGALRPQPAGSAAHSDRPPPSGAGPRVDRSGGLLLPTRAGGWTRIDPRSGAATDSDGAPDPARQPATIAATARLGLRHVELVDRGAGRRALRRADVTVAVEAGPDAAAERTYLADGLLAAAGVAMAVGDDLFVVERAAPSATACRLLRVPARGAPRWSSPVGCQVRGAVMTGEAIIVIDERGVRALAVASGAPLP